MASSPQDVLLDEFVCYYNADKLELFIHDGLVAHADDSAARVVHFHPDRAAEVADLLRELAADPAHPLFATIEIQTLYGWNGDPYSWAKFQQLAQCMSNAIIEAMRGKPQSDREQAGRSA
jgi:hypothetical protein